MYSTLRTSTTNIWILNLYPFCHTVNDSHLSPIKKGDDEGEKKQIIYIYIHIFFKSDSRKAKLRAVVAAAAVAAAKRCSAKKCGCVVRQRHIFLRDDHDRSYIPDRKLSEVCIWGVFFPCNPSVYHMSWCIQRNWEYKGKDSCLVRFTFVIVNDDYYLNLEGIMCAIILSTFAQKYLHECEDFYLFYLTKKVSLHIRRYIVLERRNLKINAH